MKYKLTAKNCPLYNTNYNLNETVLFKGKECMLHMENAKELDHLLGKWMSPSALQKAMKKAGINIFVNEYSDKYVSINLKVTWELI